MCGDDSAQSVKAQKHSKTSGETRFTPGALPSAAVSLAMAWPSLAMACRMSVGCVCRYVCAQSFTKRAHVGQCVRRLVRVGQGAGHHKPHRACIGEWCRVLELWHAFVRACHARAVRADERVLDERGFYSRFRGELHETGDGNTLQRVVGGKPRNQCRGCSGMIFARNMDSLQIKYNIFYSCRMKTGSAPISAGGAFICRPQRTCWPGRSWCSRQRK